MGKVCARARARDAGKKLRTWKLIIIVFWMLDDVFSTHVQQSIPPPRQFVCMTFRGGYSSLEGGGVEWRVYRV